MSLHITKATDANFCAIYEDMQKQFPYVEIKAKETFLTFFTATDYHAWVAQDVTNGETKNVGYMLVWLDKERNFIWLEYIAVFSPYHSKGLGSKMLRRLRELYPNVNGCFLELEKPEESDRNSKRRVAFYTKKGAFPLNFRYFYPQPKGALELDLYFLPFKPGLRALHTREVLGTIANAYRTLHQNIPHAREVFSRIRPLQNA